MYLHIWLNWLKLSKYKFFSVFVLRDGVWFIGWIAWSTGTQLRILLLNYNYQIKNGQIYIHDRVTFRNLLSPSIKYVFFFYLCQLFTSSSIQLYPNSWGIAYIPLEHTVIITHTHKRISNPAKHCRKMVCLLICKSL